MNTSKIKTDFSKLSDPNMEITAQFILASMTANTNFPTPTPTLTVVSDAIDDFSTTLSAAQTRDRNAVAEKNDARAVLQDVLLNLGNYVMMTSAGDKTKLISSGFPLFKDREPAPDITKPENIEASNGLNSGEVNVSVTAVPNARGYVHQYTVDPVTMNSNWNSTSTTRSKNTFTELEPGQKLWFRVAAIGAKGQIAYSDAVNKIVQ